MAVKIGLKYIDIWNESMEDEVQRYEREEQEKGKIVFYGPSNFTRWSARFGMTPLEEALVGKSGKKCVINRGFGSTCAEHQLYYYPRMIRPLEPAVLVYSFYGNGAAFGYSSEETWELAQRVIAYAKTDFPDIRIYLCSAQFHKAEPNGAKLRDIHRFNSWLRTFAEENENVFYIDVTKCDVLRERKDIYVEDGVHYNREGYELYADFFREELKGELEKF